MEIELRFPFEMTTNTPINATRMPKAFPQPSPSLKINQPSIAIKTGVVDTIQAVVLASDVCNPFDCSH
jgi:hypothetical protein